MIFDWKPGSSEGLLRGDEGAIAFARKKGDEGYLADMWEYQGSIFLDMNILRDGEFASHRVETTVKALNGNEPEEWADVQLKTWLSKQGVQIEASS